MVVEKIIDCVKEIHPITSKRIRIVLGLAHSFTRESIEFKSVSAHAELNVERGPTVLWAFVEGPITESAEICYERKT